MIRASVTSVTHRWCCQGQPGPSHTIHLVHPNPMLWLGLTMRVSQRSTCFSFALPRFGGGVTLAQPSTGPLLRSSAARPRGSEARPSQAGQVPVTTPVQSSLSPALLQPRPAPSQATTRSDETALVVCRYLPVPSLNISDPAQVERERGSCHRHVSRSLVIG